MRAYRAQSLRRFLWIAAVAALALLAPIAGGHAAAATTTAVAAFPAPAPTAVTSVSGRIVALATGQIAVLEDGGDGPVAFNVADSATFTRGGYNAVFEELRPGDRIEMTVDGATGTVLRASVAPGAGGIGAPSGEAALLAALGLIGAGCLLAIRLRSGALTTANGRVASTSWIERLPAFEGRQAPPALSTGRARH
ncbi:MAG TPA: hypothetical protein VFQ80_09155 [Thermomicrobiales bacterium]|nr:hypothetical protein [Thermomicrobiales bacterium]